MNFKKMEDYMQGQCIRETQILSKLANENIIRFYSYFVENEYFNIIIEYCENGDLLKVSI